MEKFSKYNDPLTGINPFIQPKRRPSSLFTYIKFIVLLPFYLIIRVFSSALCLILKIKVSGSESIRNAKVIACNHTSYLDIYVLKCVGGYERFYLIRKDSIIDLGRNEKVDKIVKPCVIFPEGASSNGNALLQFNTPEFRVNAVGYLKYSDNAVYQYGSFFKFIVGFLGHSSEVVVDFKKSSDLDDIVEISGKRQTIFTYDDKNNFIADLYKK